MKKTIVLNLLVILLIFSFIGCRSDDELDDGLNDQTRTRISTITVTGLSSYIGCYLRATISNDSAEYNVGSSDVRNLTRINNPTVDIDIFKNDFGTFYPNGINNVVLFIHQTNDVSSHLAYRRKVNIKFTDGLATISF
jgi:hypothetical protein